MNNTKKSWMTHSTKKPEGFRVLLKQRYNNQERAEPATPIKLVDLSKSEQINWNETRQQQNYTEMKDYVKKRMKSQYGDISMSQRRSTVKKRDDKSTVRRQSMRNSRVVSSLDKRPSSLSVSRAVVENQSNRNTPVRERVQKGEEKSSLDRSGAIPVTLQTLERKIIDLLDKRLYLCLQNNIKRDGELESKLESIIATLRTLQKEDPETIEADINYLDKKVKLFERLMAESMTESEIMKNYYMAKLTNRQQRKQRHRTEAYTPTQQLSLSKYCDTRIRSMVVCNSVSKQVFKPPERAAYKIYKYNNIFFNADRDKQPLPRSSYKRQYLVNPQSKDKKIVPKDHKILGKTTSDKFINSSYRDNFQSKKTQKTDIKELDACRDKIKQFLSLFRSLAVSYSRPERNSMSPNSYNVFLSRLNQVTPEKRYKYELALESKPLLTQSRREFKNNTRQVIGSEIKHKNLHKLKNQYLKKFNI